MHDFYQDNKIEVDLILKINIFRRFLNFNL